MKIIISTLFLLILSTNASASSFSVSPLFVELDTASKRPQPFRVNIKADGRLDLKFSIYKAEQMLNGKLSFVMVEEAPTVKFKKVKHRFTRAGFWALEGVYIPKKGKKNKTDIYAVMIEQEIPDDKKGINIQVRYAVVLKAENQSLRAFERADLNNFSIEGNRISIHFKNKTLKQQKVEAKYSLRDANNKLLTKGVMRSLSAKQKGSKHSSIFPMNTVQLNGSLGDILNPGPYYLTVRAKVNGKRSVIHKEKINSSLIKNTKITKGKVKKGLSVTPGNLEVQLDSNAKAMYRFKIDNFNSSLEKIKFIAKNKFGNVKFLPSSLNLKPGSSRYILLKATSFKGSLKDEFYIEVNGKKKIPLNINFQKEGKNEA